MRADRAGAAEASDRMSARRVAICIATRNRAAELERLLESLASLEIPRGVDASVLIVENADPHDGAPPACALPCTRVFEPRVGIPYARNHAIGEAARQADFIAFLDDDETVDPRWLQAALAAIDATGAAIATGPALPRFPHDAPAWAARSGAYEPVRYTQHAPRPFAYTNNVIFRSAIARGEGAPRLDESLEFTGGSDKEFFARLARQGHLIVWADDAMTYEWYPRSRLRRRWLFQRAMRLGTVARRTDGASRPSMALGALRFLARGAVRADGHALDPASATALLAWDVGRACGLVLGAIGIRYHEYRGR